MTSVKAEPLDVEDERELQELLAHYAGPVCKASQLSEGLQKNSLLQSAGKHRLAGYGKGRSLASSCFFRVVYRRSRCCAAYFSPLCCVMFLCSLRCPQATSSKP